MKTTSTLKTTSKMKTDLQTKTTLKSKDGLKIEVDLASAELGTAQSKLVSMYKIKRQCLVTMPRHAHN